MANSKAMATLFSPTDNPTKNEDNPTENSDNPTENSDNPTENEDNPTENEDNPTENSDNPTENGDNPTENGDNPTLKTERSSLDRSPRASFSRSALGSMIKCVTTSVLQSDNCQGQRLVRVNLLHGQPVSIGEAGA